MKIAIFVKNFKPPWNEGVKNNIKNISRGLKSKGHEILFLSISDRSAVVALDEGTSYLFKSPLYKTKFRALFYLCGFLNLLIKGGRVLAQEKPDLFMVSFGTNNFIALLLRRFSRVNFKIAQFFYCDWYAFKKVPLKALLLEHINQFLFNNAYLTRFSIAHCDLVIVTARYLREKLSALCPCVPVVFIPTGVDITHFSPNEAMRKKYKEQFAIAFVGHLTHSKGFSLFLEAVKPLCEELDIRLVVAASHPGSESNLLRAVDRRRYKIDVYVTVDIAVVYNSVDLVVYPLRYPFGTIAYPNIALEAMACAKAVVISRFEGTQEIIDDGVDGFLVAPNDAVMLRKKIRELFHNKALCAQVGACARNKIVDHFSWDAITTRIDAALKEHL